MGDSRDPEVLVIGAACIDVKGRPLQPLRFSTSNQGLIRLSPGGAGRNIAENLARLGVRTNLLSVVGTDNYGRTILEETNAAGVCMEHVRVAPGKPSAIYLAVLDENGHMAVSVDAMECLELLNPPYIYANRYLIEQASMVVVDANLSTKTLGTVLALAKRYDVPVCMTTVSVSLARKVRRYLKDYHIVIGNLDEGSALCGKPLADVDDAIIGAREMVATGTKLVIITLGAHGLVYASSTGSGYIPAIQCDIVDATGAGDALAAGVIYGYLNDFPIDEALRVGVSAATLTLTCRDTVCQELDQETLYQRMVI
ncbi:MAG: carbohydrate kinase family protein [Dehalococcoidales bacterium]|nr:carbohydrate kinase family protein [Dehalococcoidales bacterium]